MIGAKVTVSGLNSPAVTNALLHTFTHYRNVEIKRMNWNDPRRWKAGKSGASGVLWEKK